MACKCVEQNTGVWGAGMMCTIHLCKWKGEFTPLFLNLTVVRLLQLTHSFYPIAYSGTLTIKRFLHISSLTRLIREGKPPICAAPDSRATVNRDKPMWIIGSELCLKAKTKKSYAAGESWCNESTSDDCQFFVPVS